MIRKLLAIIFLLPSLALAIDYEANVKALSPTGWWKGYYGNTISTTQGVSVAGDRSGNSRTFTQGTAANQPFSARQDNKENRVRYSETFDGTLGYWFATRSTIILNQAVHPLTGLTTVALLQEDGTAANSHELRTENQYLIAGQSYVYRVITKAAGRTMIRLSRAGASGWAGNFNLSTGATTVVTGTPTLTMTDLTGGWYLCEMLFTPTVSESSQLHIYLMSGGATAYNGDATSGAYITDVQLRDTLSDSTYIKTDAFPFFRGVSGIPALHFDGVNDNYIRIPAMSDLFALGAKTVYVVFRPQDITSTYILSQNSNRFGIYIDATSKITLFNNDGGGFDLNTTAAITANNIYIFIGKHDGTNLYTALNSTTFNTGVPSGNSVDLGGAPALFYDRSSTTQFLPGDLVEMLTFNVVHNSTQVQTVYDYLSWTLSNPWKRVEVTP